MAIPQARATPPHRSPPQISPARPPTCMCSRIPPSPATAATVVTGSDSRDVTLNPTAELLLVNTHIVFRRRLARGWLPVCWDGRWLAAMQLLNTAGWSRKKRTTQPSPLHPTLASMRPAGAFSALSGALPRAVSPSPRFGTNLSTNTMQWRSGALVWRITISLSHTTMTHPPHPRLHTRRDRTRIR